VKDLPAFGQIPRCDALLMLRVSVASLGAGTAGRYCRGRAQCSSQDVEGNGPQGTGAIAPGSPQGIQSARQGSPARPRRGPAKRSRSWALGEAVEAGLGAGAVNGGRSGNSGRVPAAQTSLTPLLDHMWTSTTAVRAANNDALPVEASRPSPSRSHTPRSTSIEKPATAARAAGVLPARCARPQASTLVEGNMGYTENANRRSLVPMGPIYDLAEVKTNSPSSVSSSCSPRHQGLVERLQVPSVVTRSERT